MAQKGGKVMDENLYDFDVAIAELHKRLLDTKMVHY